MLKLNQMKRKHISGDRQGAKIKNENVNANLFIIDF